MICVTCSIYIRYYHTQHVHTFMYNLWVDISHVFLSTSIRKVSYMWSLVFLLSYVFVVAAFASAAASASAAICAIRVCPNQYLHRTLWALLSHSGSPISTHGTSSHLPRNTRGTITHARFTRHGFTRILSARVFTKKNTYDVLARNRYGPGQSLSACVAR